MEKQYDYLIVGAGLYGATFAQKMRENGKKCLVIDKRTHIAGNAYTEERDDQHLHMYGPHIFNTNDKNIWEYVQKFAEFNNFVYSPVAVYKDELYSLPFSMWTFSKLWKIKFPHEAKKIIEEQSKHIGEPKNLEEQAIKLVGTEVYEKLIKHYTEKQWRKPCTKLPKEIIQRLPVRFTYDNNYYYSKYQGIPIGGYTKMVDNMLKGIEVRLEVDYLKDTAHWNSLATTIVYTGPIDRYYDYKFGELEYKTVGFLHHRCGETVDNFQGVAVTNHTDSSKTYTRIIEHQHFEKKQVTGPWITFETPVRYKAEETEPMYPVNDQANNTKYEQYKKLADQEKNIIFGGRLAEYKYYNMDQVIKSSLSRAYGELLPI